VSRPHRAARPGRPATARAVAASILYLCRESRSFATDLIDQQLSCTSLSDQDRRLVTQLVYGVLRRRGSLDAIIKLYLIRPAHRVDARLWDVLYLGAYQLAFLSHVPAHAAVHETVELADPIGGRGAKGFVNGLLRRVAELLTDKTAEGPAADALPLEQGRYRRLDGPVLPDPEDDPAAYLAAGFSWPAWLAERWLERFGWDECARLGFWFVGAAPLSLRVNRLRGDRDDYLLDLTALNVAAVPGSHPQAVRLEDHLPIRSLPGYAEGRFAVQDESSMRVATALNPKPGMTVLDLCAAPGGKTTHLAELMRNQGKVVACDIDDRRLATLTSLCERLGVTIVEPVRLDADKDAEPPAGPFDAALVDVPCSNTGVLGRRPEARWRLDPRDLPRLVQLQTKLLIQAAERLRPGGAVVYSTCSIEPQENQGVVRNVLKGLPELALEAEEESVPGRPSDGGYWARLRKREGER
jgi:16S rRNA (cytosine967-C5)-methyltransferase